jgi:ATP-binding protein involved in chromosome partitioning
VVFSFGADETDMPFLGSIPLDPAVRAGGDAGEPAVLGDSGVGEAFRSVTGAVADMVGVVRRRAHLDRTPEPAEH